MGFSRNFKFLIGISRSFILVEFGGVFRLVEFGKFLRHGVDISRNFGLVDFSRFFRF